MSKCTAAQAVEAMSYWLGYYEKESESYSHYREKKYFDVDAGHNNWTYPGYLCGINGQPWCAMTVSTAIYEACGNEKSTAKQIMHGVWPYAACNQMWDAAPSNYKGRRGAWKPIPGDVIIFSNDGTTREHTGMVYYVDNTYVYTIEGNSGDQCRKRSYLLTCDYIYGYVRPLYASGGGGTVVPPELYGKKCCSDPELHELSKGCAGPEVLAAQAIMRGLGVKGSNGKVVEADGDFGPSTKVATQFFQKDYLGFSGKDVDGEWGHDTWTAALKKVWLDE